MALSDITSTITHIPTHSHREGSSDVEGQVVFLVDFSYFMAYFSDVKNHSPFPLQNFSSIFFSDLLLKVTQKVHVKIISLAFYFHLI